MLSVSPTTESGSNSWRWQNWVNYSLFGSCVGSKLQVIWGNDNYFTSRSKTSRRGWGSFITLFWCLIFENFRDPVETWTFKQWKECLNKGTNKLRFDYRLNFYGRICHLRTMLGHPGTERIDPQCSQFDTINLPCWEIPSSIKFSQLIGRWRTKEMWKTDLLYDSVSFGQRDS